MLQPFNLGSLERKWDSEKLEQMGGEGTLVGPPPEELGTFIIRTITMIYFRGMLLSRYWLLRRYRTSLYQKVDTGG